MRGTNLLVFRDNASQITGRKLGERLIDAVDKTARGNDREAMLNALLLAGQAECVIADSGSADDTARSLTDALAMALIGQLEEARADHSSPGRPSVRSQHTIHGVAGRLARAKKAPRIKFSSG